MSDWRIHILANGRFSVRFCTEEGLELMPSMENIPSLVFLLQSGSRCLIVDTGFDPEDVGGQGSSAVQGQGESLTEGLKGLGLAPGDISDVLMTHLHWDHTAGMGLFPGARFHVQADALRCFCNLNPNEETYYRPGHWLHLLDRMVFVEGSHELMPGIRLHHTGGHCPGHQAVLVETGQGTVALAGDLPFDYSGLWSALPADFWETYRRGKGGRLWWTKEQWETLYAFMEKKGLMNQPCQAESLGYGKLRRMCSRVFLTHAPELYPSPVGVLSVPV
ncbi:N-acyl homoserine lactonase family protein [Desulfobotulus mexicanus]|uniref:N-acyl homoserine lactonase family protein n=1 Tax=Desulfobotulus mexicanus TaxID=2586642 RepID=A0A5Q4VCL0_9BACT|nr:N-acyl homoserine lactonase family protein [Desulfobotulus mexicanus]TYT74708.1 N-acyl homoserine lactonase family protein [Desulfobotulus mexicanus]